MGFSETIKGVPCFTQPVLETPGLYTQHNQPSGGLKSFWLSM